MATQEISTQIPYKITAMDSFSPAGAWSQYIEDLVDVNLGFTTGPQVTVKGDLLLDTQTANCVPYLDGSKILQTSLNMTFDGTNLTLGSGAVGVDYTLTFNGENNDGVIAWDEGQPHWLFQNTIVNQGKTFLAQGVGGGFYHYANGDYTDASNEYILMFHDTSKCRILTGSTGAGTDRDLHLQPATENTYIGDSLTEHFHFDSSGKEPTMKMFCSLPNEAIIVHHVSGNGELSRIRFNNAGPLIALDLQYGAPASWNTHFYASTTETKTYKNFIIGNGEAGVDYTLTFDGETNDGLITWKEDENHFQFGNDISMVGNQIGYDGSAGGLSFDASNNATFTDTLTSTGNFTASAAATVTGLTTLNAGLKRQQTRITSADSPYTVLATDRVIFANTDTAAVTVNLPAGVAETNYKIVNTGTSGNAVTLNPNGAENLLGANSAFTLNDGDALEVDYSTDDGWY